MCLSVSVWREIRSQSCDIITHGFTLPSSGRWNERCAVRSSASDLYLSLVIFSNTALAFMFAESVRWHLISLTSHLMSLHLVSEIPLLFLSLTLNLLCAQLPVSSLFFSLLNKIRYVHIFFSDVGMFSTESNYTWSKKCSSIAEAQNKIQTISRRLNLHFL